MVRRALREKEESLNRKRAEAALGETLRQLRYLFDNLDEVFFTVDVTEGKTLQVSQACERVLGRPRKEFLENPQLLYDIIHEEDRPTVDATQQELLSGIPTQGQHRIVLPNGEIRWMEARFKPTVNESGTVVRIDGFISDITKRKKAEEELLIQSTYFRQLFENSPEGITMEDEDDRVVSVNTSFQEMFQYTTEELRGRRVTDLIVPPSKIEESQKLSERSRSGSVVSKDTVRKRKDGDLIDVIVIRFPVILSGKRVGTYGIYNDISDLKKLETQFLRAQRLESIGTLAGGIAHDLNNILGPILLGSEILRKRTEDERSLAILDTMESSAHRGAELIKQVLSFARGTAGDRMSVQMRHLCKELSAVLEETLPKSIHLKLDIPKDLWMISGDPTQLHQVMMNICVNARDAMPSGGTLSISASNILVGSSLAAANPEATTGPHILISVSDTGEGMTPEIVNRIFDPFFTTKEPGRGTGLGLSTVHTIVKGHGGFVIVDSRVGEGSTFKIYLPATHGEEKEEHAAGEAIPQGKGELILVVDDEESIREMTKSTLELFGYRVLTVQNGAEGITVYHEHKKEISAVITDMMMPVMDGFDMVRSLKRSNPALKLICISGLMELGEVADRLKTHDVVLLSKPHTSEELLRALRKLLDQ